MRDHDSLVQHLLDVYQNLLLDAVTMTDPSYNPARDFTCVKSRVASEGLSFFTKTLPSLGKQLDAALAKKQPFSPCGFQKMPHRCYPKFLGFLWELIVDDLGNVHQAVNAKHVAVARQLTYIFYKLEIPYSTAEETSVLNAFEATEAEIDTSDKKLGEIVSGDSLSDIMVIARALISRVVSVINFENLLPAHGPGAVATGERQWEKMHFKRIYSRIEEKFPFSEFFFASVGHMCDELHKFENAVTLESGTAKVVLVPKDSRGPRLISCEPLEYQWVQQAIARPLMDRIESCPLTKGRVNFTDQSVNRRLALYGSMGADWVTLDMKEASDRVSLELVRLLFQGTCLWDYLWAARSTSTLLPDGRTIALKKFAPMGSALCFPVESLTFWALSVAAAHIIGKVPLHRALQSIYVYGDDIITNAEVCGIILQYLPLFGLMFNEGKCCTQGFFRESCGMDAFQGTDVAPVKFRSVWNAGNRGTKQLLSYIEYSNILCRRGYWNTVAYIEREIERLYAFPIPSLSFEAEEVGFIHYRRYLTHLDISTPRRWNRFLQRTEIKVRCVHVPAILRRQTEWERIFWRLTSSGTQQQVVKARLVQPPKGELPLRGPGSNAVQHVSVVPPRLEVRFYPVRGRITRKPRWCAVAHDP